METRRGCPSIQGPQLQPTRPVPCAWPLLQTTKPAVAVVGSPRLAGPRGPWRGGRLRSLFRASAAGHTWSLSGSVLTREAEADDKGARRALPLAWSRQGACDDAGSDSAGLRRPGQVAFFTSPQVTLGAASPWVPCTMPSWWFPRTALSSAELTLSLKLPRLWASGSRMS